MALPQRIYLVTGKAYSGKDTTADYIVSRYNLRGYRTIKLALADQLKIISQQLIKLFYGIDIPLKEFYNSSTKDMVRPNLPPFAGKPFTLRSVLQHVGTEIFRTYTYDSIWCDILYKKMMGYDIVVISDCRFPNELNYFRSLGIKSTSIKLIRESVISEEHQSESYDLDVDFTLHNDSDIKNLFNYIDNIISKDVL